ncbi:hypothetical protein [Sporichthya polymorpha]|uniref:hypothetical protein n=1 Tax=Sporichthya polymorpha TaxID=35751 RepID=UPI000367B427|nr:hypothetical protein [Sporichthya polymorpha]
MPLLGVLGGVAASSLMLASPVGAETSYDAYAKAVGIDFTLRNPSIPVGFVVQAIGPEADAHQTSLSTRDANASFPYFGDVVPTLPGLGSAITGFPVPPYPFIASSGAGQKPVVRSYPGITLRAESGTTSTIASGVAGTTAFGGSADARVDEAEDGSVTSTSEAEYKAVDLSGVFKLSGVRSRAETTADGTTGKLTRSSSLSIGLISVPGLSFTVPKSSPEAIPIPIPVPGVPNVPPIPAPPFPFPAGGTTFVAPQLGIQDGYFVVTAPGQETQKYTVPAQPVIDGLKAAGVTFTYQAAEITSNGIIAPVANFRFDIPAPPENQYYSGPTPVTMTTGLTVANVDLTPLGSEVPTGIQPSGAEGGTAAPGTGVAGVDAAGLGVLPGTTAGVAGGVPVAGSGVPGVSGAGEETVAAEFVRVGTALKGAGGLDIYLALAAAGVVTLLAAWALGLIGVRRLWT